MRANGITKLVLLGPILGDEAQHARLVAAETVEAFSQAVPDQKKWLQRFAEACGHKFLHQLMAHLQYSGPIELLSMHCCLLLVGSPAFILL
jgi:hypothetical protein